MEIERQQFTFYRSFLRTAEALPSKSRNEFLLSVIRYALDGTEPGKLTYAARSSFEAVRPILDKAIRKSISGKMGGDASGEARSKNEANRSKNEANRSKNEANRSTGESPAPVITGGNNTRTYISNTFSQGGTGETGSNGDYPAPPESEELYQEVFRQLYFYEIPLTTKDRAEIINLCGQYGSDAVLDAIYAADRRGVYKWSYIRAIVTSGGVSQRGGGISRRVQETNDHIQHHGDPPSPAMIEAARWMLEEYQDESNKAETLERPGGAALDHADELLPEAVEICMEQGQCQTSVLQRRLQIGYARAARILDEMEELGIVGPAGASPRQIQISREDWEVMKQGTDPSLHSE